MWYQGKGLAQIKQQTIIYANDRQFIGANLRHAVSNG